MRNRFVLIVLALLVRPVWADAGTVKANALSVTNAWIRALPAGVPSGGYFTLHNGTARDLVMIAAASPACGMLMLHKSSDQGGMTSMADVPEVPAPAGGIVTFSPGGYHLMCTNATPAIKPGNKIPVTLKFKDGSSVAASFVVRNAAGR